MTWSGPIFSAHLSAQATTSALTKFCLSAKFCNKGGNTFLEYYFACSPSASTKRPNNYTNAFKTALLGSAILYFMLSISSLSPIGYILILASLIIASTLSAPSFLTFQSLFLNIGNSLGVSIFDISVLGNRSSKPPYFPEA